MITVEKEQLKILKKVKKFLIISKKFGESIASTDLFYFCPYGYSKGTAKLFSFYNKIYSSKIFIISTIKDIYKLIKIGPFKFLPAKKKLNYETIIINWASKNDFSKNGSFYDKHFNISSSSCRDIHWVLIYLDHIPPNKLMNNISLIYNEKKIFNLKLILKIFFNLFFNYKKNKFIFYELSYLTQLANFSKKIVPFLINKNTSKAIMPYEGQPFQNTVFREINSINKKIKTIGYIHSYPIGLPSNLFKRAGHPKQLILSSVSQKYCFKKYLGWSEKDLKILPSARLLKKNHFNMNSKIFLPIQFTNLKLILSNFESLILREKLNLKNFQIKNHPSCNKSLKHIKLIRLLKNIIENYKFEKKDRKNLSIFIGPTGSVIEALERGVDVYHICEFPEFESYSKKLWKYIHSYKIDNNLFKYSCVGKNKLINFGKHINLYKKYIY